MLAYWMYLKREVKGEQIWRTFKKTYKWRTKRAMGRALKEREKLGVIERVEPVVPPYLKPVIDYIEETDVIYASKLARDLGISYYRARRYLRELMDLGLVRMVGWRRITRIIRGRPRRVRVRLYTPTFNYTWRVVRVPAAYRAAFVYLRELTVYINYIEGRAKKYEYKCCRFVTKDQYEREEEYSRIYDEMKETLLRVFYWLVELKMPPLSKWDLEEGETNRDAWVSMRIWERTKDWVALIMFKPDGRCFRLGEGNIGEIREAYEAGGGAAAYEAVRWYIPRGVEPRFYLGLKMLAEMRREFGARVFEAPRGIPEEYIERVRE